MTAPRAAGRPGGQRIEPPLSATAPLWSTAANGRRASLRRRLLVLLLPGRSGGAWRTVTEHRPVP